MITDRQNRQIRDLRISITDRCNFRCGYCMPEEVFGSAYKFLPRDHILSFEEIIRLTRIYVELGVRKVRITGGEPLLRQEIENLIAAISGIAGVEDLALTTNGYLLQKKAKQLREAGLNRLTISLDTLNPELFRQLAGKHLDLNRVLQGIDKAVEVELVPIKLNTVIQKGINEDEIIELAQFARENDFIIRFIEFMDVGTLNGWRMEKVITAGSVVETITSIFPASPVAKKYRSEVATRYRYDDGKGEFGVISSVSQPFCESCSRIRLSAEGKIYTCLFSDVGHDVKTLLRQQISDNKLKKHLISIWQNRTDRYSEERTDSPSTHQKVEMYRIGG